MIHQSLGNSKGFANTVATLAAQYREGDQVEIRSYGDWGYFGQVNYVAPDGRISIYGKTPDGWVSGKYTPADVRPAQAVEFIAADGGGRPIGLLSGCGTIGSCRADAIVNTEPVVAQAAEQATWSRDFAAGGRKFWQGMSLIYCANGAERAGFWAAADEDAAEYRQYCEHGDFVRSLSH